MIKGIAKNKGKSVSEIFVVYIDLLKNIEEQLSKEELSPWLKEFGGMVNTGRNENIISIYNIKK